MKKFIALLLCLVIFVPVFTIGVSAEKACNCTDIRQTLVQMVNRSGFLQKLLAQIEMMHAAHGTQPPLENESSKPQEAPDKEENDNSGIQDFERQVAELVNVERAKYGLSPLTLNAELSNGARMKSKDMHDNKYFSHTSPTYGSPFDMMKSLGITYRTAGENIAMGYHTPEAVVKAWMNSKGHRDNILNASYTEIGVGYIANGGYYTQWFRG